MKFSPSPFEKCGLVPAGRFRRRVNYTTRREKGKHVKKRKKKKEKKKRSSRAAHIKRELNVEISVSPRRKRDGGGGPSSSPFFGPPPPQVFQLVEPCIYLYATKTLFQRERESSSKNSTPSFKRPVTRHDTTTRCNYAPDLYFSILFVCTRTRSTTRPFFPEKFLFFARLTYPRG